MALAKKSMGAASGEKHNQTRIFFYSQAHVDNYHQTYAKHDINRYGPTRHLIASNEAGKQEEFKYTHTTLIPSGSNPEAVQNAYDLKGTQIVWQGPESRVQYFGPRASIPQTGGPKSQL